MESWVVEAKSLMVRFEMVELAVAESVLKEAREETLRFARLRLFAVTFDTARFTRVDVPEVAVIFPAVSAPMFAVGPEEEPVREPVTLPVTFPMTLPLRFPPLRVRYVNDAPAPVVVAEMLRMARDEVPVKVAPIPETLPLEERFVTAVPWSVVVPLVAVIVPKVPTPALTAGPEEEPVRVPVTFPVTLPVRFPVMPPVTTKFVVVAVPETTRLVVEADEVAINVPIVPAPIVAEFARMLFVNVCAWFHVLAVVVPNARETVFAEKRTGYVAVIGTW